MFILRWISDDEASFSRATAGTATPQHFVLYLKLIYRSSAAAGARARTPRAATVTMRATRDTYECRVPRTF